MFPSLEGRALPHRVYPVTRAGEAFRLMQRSKHIGKIVIAFDEAVPVERRRTRLSLNPDATYLVVGGLGGFGAATTRRLIDRGARHLALVSRRGAMTPEARELMGELTARGIEVTVHAADVANRRAMAEVFTAIDHSGHPLLGVIHAAMVLDDRLLVDMDDEAISTALNPKIGGALVLDELTREQELDFFVLYSSVVSVIGNIKQANYVAGNLFLEALARARRAQGKPAVAIQFGALGETGYIARTGIGLHMEMAGMRLTSPDRALDAFEDVVSERRTDVVAAGVFEWDRMREFLPSLSTPRLAGLPSSCAEQGESAIAVFLRKVAELPREDALRAVEDALTEQLASIMQTAPDRIDRTSDLDKLGVDSLMAMELLLLIRKRFQYQASMADLLKGAKSIRAFAELVVNHLTREAAT
jgi:acyl carrier protein/NAD(P)-dependent dehydrogenase (short-subunit alcohol dehydrogenase family)